MARLMSFAKTTHQVIDRSKTVTRRTGWKFLTPGARLWACEKTMGLQKGEKVRRLCLIEVVSVRRERLDAILDYDETCPECGGTGTAPDGVFFCQSCNGDAVKNSDAAREGFPQMSGKRFIEFFCYELGCLPGTEVTRIEFRYVDESEVGQ